MRVRMVSSRRSSMEAQAWGSGVSSTGTVRGSGSQPVVMGYPETLEGKGSDASAGVMALQPEG